MLDMIDTTRYPPRMAKPRPSRHEYGIISVRHVDLNLWHDVAVFALRRGLTMGEALNRLLLQPLLMEKQATFLQSRKAAKATKAVNKSLLERNLL